MRSARSWFEEYGVSHQNGFNKLVHWVCVPSIMFSILGLLWSLDVPSRIGSISPFLNWSVLAAIPAIIFYFLLSKKLAAGMLVVTGLMLSLIYWIDTLQTPLWIISLGIFIIAWIGQFIGHLVEGRKPSFFKDLQFLLIGPIWLLSNLYARLKIQY